MKLAKSWKGGGDMKISLRGARLERNLTQAQASQKIGVTKETISNWEKGRTAPTAPQLIKLCELYGVQITDIFLPDKLAKSEN